MVSINWYRVAQVVCAGIVGGAAASAFLAPMNDNAAAAEAIAVAGGIVGFCSSLWGERRSLDEAAEAEELRPAPVPETAASIHEEMRDRVAAVRDAVSRMVETASRAHHDRVAVHERCQVLEEENERLAAHVDAARQARDVLALLPGRPCACASRAGGGGSTKSSRSSRACTTR